uniref:SA1_PKSC n=1 Tax=uncultured bacterial symbiont of Discodermia dissoluta TaxID=323654 RepID=Q49HL0_9BACT|nr:SA1_PKSC [uncultured bacterial symbiont of Discodermia dissoluta]
MSELDRYIGLTKKLLAELNLRNREISELKQPIAIVGMACRFPSGENLAAFWRALECGESAVREDPSDGVRSSAFNRFRQLAPRNDRSRWGAFVHGIDQFDAEFFRIAPVEARYMDPQQRLLLETSWEALEEAGIAAGRLKGSRTGVYVGISSCDYRDWVSEAAETDSSLYAATGNSGSTAIGRVAFALGLEGPAFAVDTACSSSLVAIHQAAVGLQRSEADLALAGGVHAILSLAPSELFATGGMLSPEGLCKTFDASANGFVRGEGCGVLVLKRLADAQADGDRIWGVIRGSAVNHDGASAGLTVPSGEAQAKVIADALLQAGIEPSDVDYLEAHGTGTQLGDPIEVNAAMSVFGRGRPVERPLLMGSVKTNIGHLEAAAGVAGVIKVILAINHRAIPPHLNFHDPSPHVNWQSLPVRVTAGAESWPSSPERPRRAGVSSFSLSGTNAHVILEEGTAQTNSAESPEKRLDFGPAAAVAPGLAGDGPPLAEDQLRARAARILTLSAKSADAMRELAGRYRDWLEKRSVLFSSDESGPALSLADVAWTASVGRNHFDYRCGLVFDSFSELMGRLEELASSSRVPVARKVDKIAFVFSGQGSQWAGMGRDLYETEPVVRSVLDRCEQVIQETRGVSLLDVMFDRPGKTGDLNHTAWAQPALYALESALAELWGSVGVRPAAVLGHSVGELAAARAAGVFGLEEGLRFAAARGELMGSLPADGARAGAMLAVFAPAERLEALLDEASAEAAGPRLSLAVDNGTHQVVSGSAERVLALEECLASQGIRAERLATSHAFHSEFMDPILDDLEAALEDTWIAAPEIALVSNVSGGLVERNEVLDGGYWRRQAREPVAFADCVATLAGIGIDLIVEIGPRPVLAPLVEQLWPSHARQSMTAQDAGREPDGTSRGPVVVASQRSAPQAAALDGSPSTSRLVAGTSNHSGGFEAAVAEAYAAGTDLRLEGLFAGERRRRVSLPTYPFQRRRHWIDSPKRRRLTDADPLLGVRRDSAAGEITFETEMLPSAPEWLADHQVYGMVVAPGALHASLAATAASLASGPTTTVIDDFQLHAPLILARASETEELQELTVQTVVSRANEAGSRTVRIYSRNRDDEAWVLHAEGQFRSGSAEADVAERVDIESLKARLPEMDVLEFYNSLASVGIEHGPAFRVLQSLHSSHSEAVGEVALPSEPEAGDLCLHPALLDGCSQVLAALVGRSAAAERAVYLPFSYERLWLSGRLPQRVFCHARLQAPNAVGNPHSESSAPSGESGHSGRTSPESLTGDLEIYDASGTEVGRVSGFSMKRSTRSALLSAVEGIGDLLYEVVWRESHWTSEMRSAEFLASPGAVRKAVGGFQDGLLENAVSEASLGKLLVEIERLSQAYALAALDELGWRRKAGEAVEPARLRLKLKVVPKHGRLLNRLLEMLAEAGVLRPVQETEAKWIVAVGEDAALPDGFPSNPEQLAASLNERYPQGSHELGLLALCGNALPEVLRGQVDPLELMFGGKGPGARELYWDAPALQAANRMVGKAVAAAVGDLPPGRRLRILEVGAGTGGTTSAVVDALPPGRFDYTFTDISAGFLSAAESRFGGHDSSFEYRVLDIEGSLEKQGIDAHSYDLLIAANVLHATRDLRHTLSRCCELLAPSGQLLALEGFVGQGWLDLTFGMLEGWWRFADDYRPNHALARESAWRLALKDGGFGDTDIIGIGDPDPDGHFLQGVILARAPSRVTEAPGTWVLAADGGSVAAEAAARLAERNQAVVLAVGDAAAAAGSVEQGGITKAFVDCQSRDAWRSLLENLPANAPLRGVVHFAALDGSGASTNVATLAADVKRATASALALLQGLGDSGAVPSHGLWFVTKGAQIVQRQPGGQLAGSTVWGLGKTVAWEAPHLQPRMVDLDPQELSCPVGFVDNLLHPDRETHLAYRSGGRHVARLVRSRDAMARVRIPNDGPWRIEQDPDGGFADLRARTVSRPTCGAGEVRVSVEALGLNTTGLMADTPAGGSDAGLATDFYGRILELGPDVEGLLPGNRVVGFCPGSFASELVTQAALVAPAPTGLSAAQLAAMPTAFVTAEIAFDVAKLAAGDRVLVHVGAGGIGLAAVQLAKELGAEVYATGRAAQQQYLRSQGVAHVFDSCTTEFSREISRATEGRGVNVVLNDHADPGFIEASLSCLELGGRLVQLAAPESWSAEAMAAERPDIGYHILVRDPMTATDPALAGTTLRGVLERVGSGSLSPVAYSAWPLAASGEAMRHVSSGAHAGTLVLTAPPLRTGRLREDGTYLVTGGLGGIGLKVAGWLADQGAGAIVLNGRREPDDSCREAVESLQRRGVAVQVEIADIADAEAVKGMLGRIESALPPLAGVIHSVGALSDAVLPNQSWERFERVLWPKVLGAWQLHRSTLDLDLDFFVLFSSVIGVTGNVGQANHAAANAFLDQLARHRRALGLPGQAIAWGPWSGLGEAETRRAQLAERSEAGGMGWIAPSQGLRALDFLVRQDVGVPVVLSMDWSAFDARSESPPPLFDDLLSESQRAAPVVREAPGDLWLRLRDSPTAAREELLVSLLQRELQGALRMHALPDPTVGFFDLGMDSLMAVELRGRLNRAFDGDYILSNTAVFDYPNTVELARHIASGLGVPPEDERPRPRVFSQRDSDAVAIVGMACRFPGAPDLQAFWRLLEAGRHSVTNGRLDSAVRVPTSESSEKPGHDAPYQWGAFIEDIDEFDARFFRIPAIEARFMDPQQRMLLETSWQALEEAGIDPGGLSGSRTGVFAGVASNDYRDLVGSLVGDRAGIASTTGNINSVAIGRVAYSLGLEGPAIAVDTACSSSLVAVHQAIASLRNGEADMALAGGVNAILLPQYSTLFADAGMLSPDGRCRAFDASANGFVRGEGCGMVVLKRLADAEADGDRIWGVIRGSAVNQNGASAGLAVPNGLAQERVIEEALARAGIAPSEVDYLEAHGTGGELSDPIEILAAGKVYGTGRKPERPLLIGTVKTNIGHLEAAAGVAGMIKVLLSMRHGLVPPHLHFRDPNPRVDWDQLPVRVASSATDWPETSSRPARASVSAFGISGSNAHVVLEQYVSAASESTGQVNGVPNEEPIRPERPVLGPLASEASPSSRLATRGTRLLPLSGQSGDALAELARRYVAWLEARQFTGPASEGEPGETEEFEDPALLADIAWTASVGRSHFDYRAGLVFSSGAELRQKLEAVAEQIGEAGSRKISKVAFVFSGEGSQWVGMGRGLYETEPVFRAVLDRCDHTIRSLRDVSLLDVMFGTAAGAGDLDDPAWTQPALYALECSLVELWSSLGILPRAVLGQGAGELAAARAAGVFELEDGLRFALERSALISALPSNGAGEGALAAVVAKKATLESAVSQINAELEGAGLNLVAADGKKTVLRGPSAAVAMLEGLLASEGISVERLTKGQARHGEPVEPVLDDIESVLEGITMKPLDLPFVSGATGQLEEVGDSLGGEYWRRNVREQAAFAQGVSSLAGLGVDAVVEIGPGQVMGPLVASAWPTAEAAGRLGLAGSDGGPVVVASLLGPADGGSGIESGFLEAVAGIYAAGGSISFEGLFADEKRRRCSLPTYPFQRRRHWID